MTDVDHEVARIHWMISATKVRFTMTPTLGTDDWGRPFCLWHVDRNILQLWGLANLTGKHQFRLGREDSEHFNCDSIEFVFFGDEEDAEKVRATWVKS